MKKTILHALESSARILMPGFGKRIKVAKRENQNAVATEFDLKAEKNIVGLIKNKFPSHNIISEETGLHFKNSSYTWIVDPIDGTSNYVSRLPWFGSIVAVLKDWHPIRAGASLPFYKNIYYAEKNRGVFCKDKKIKVTEEKNLKNALVSYSLDYSKNSSKIKSEISIIKLLVKSIRNLRATNSVFDFCAVAEGKLGGYLNLTNKIWDIAGPYLIIKEAGGKFTDIFGKNISFESDKNSYSRNFTIIAASKNLHPKLLEIVKKATRENEKGGI